jgi:hypothetical protein
MGEMAALAWIFPRLMMQKKITVFGKESVAAVQDRGHYGIGKLVIFNITSINGLASVLFLLSFLLGVMEICMFFYFVLTVIIAIGSLWT